MEGLVAAAFELDSAAATVLGISRAVADRMTARRFGGGLGPSKRPRLESSTVPNVVPGGIGHYLGDFRKTPIGVGESDMHRYGYQSEVEVVGQLSSNDVQYFGVQSVNIQMISRALSFALFRHIMWRHYRKTYVTNSELVIVPVGGAAVGANAQPSLARIILHTKYKLSDGTVAENAQATILITPTTTVEDVVSSIQGLLLTTQSFGANYTSDGYALTGYQLLYQAGGVVSAANVTFQSYSPKYSIDDQKVFVSVKQVVQLQNTTRADTATSTGVRDALDANPIVGKCYHMKGIYPDVESTNLVSSSFAIALGNFSNADHRAGIFVPPVNPTEEWKALPKPQNFRNIMTCQAGLRLEPGDIKKDVLHFRYYGNLQELIAKLAYIRTATANTGPESLYSRGRLGTYKLYAFEKVVPTGADAVEMNYHVDRYIACIMPLTREELSTRSEFNQYKIDRKLGTVTPPVALQLPALQSVPAAEVPDEDALDD